MPLKISGSFSGFQPNTNTFLNKSQNTLGLRCPQTRPGVQAGASSVCPTPSHKRVFCDGVRPALVEAAAADPPQSWALIQTEKPGSSDSEGGGDAETIEGNLF